MRAQAIEVFINCMNGDMLKMEVNNVGELEDVNML